MIGEIKEIREKREEGMINATRILALDRLFEKLGDKKNPSQNLEKCIMSCIYPIPSNLFYF